MIQQHAAEHVTSDAEPGLLELLVGDGRPLLALFAVGLIVSGIFALFLAATVTFLPPAFRNGRVSQLPYVADLPLRRPLERSHTSSGSSACGLRESRLQSAKLE